KHMSIDIDELLKILPQLIRENDTVKGAILTALSGVVATHLDVEMVIQAMEKRFEAVDRQFAMNAQEHVDLQNAIGALHQVVEGHFEELSDGMKQVQESIDSLRDHLVNNV
ncbi:MAG TPA: hypothetical protein VKK79_22075, partial [Candidatus Lokiarchaeia archaeon]|nr:hypothetical protein [Candidatus Lokiarchaeia archaeon]